MQNFYLITLSRLSKYSAKKDAVHFLGLSGGKDSSACVAVAEYAGIDYRPFVCDTDHEKPITKEYIAEFQSYISPKINIIKRETSEEEFAARREIIRKTWTEWYTPSLRSKAIKQLGVRQMFPPVAPELIERACEALKPSGNAFRDRIMVHGAMPRKTGKFCSLELKTELAWAEIIQKHLDIDHCGEDVIWWSGVREEESKAREGLNMYEPCGMDITGYVSNLRPIYNMKHHEVFQVLKYMGLPWNKDYERGAKRVGCNECFEANKAAINNSFSRDTSGLEFLAALERDVAIVSRFAVNNGLSHIPFFREAYRLEKYGNWATVEQVFEWSKTKRGGKEVASELEFTSCDSIYGLCE